MSGTFASSGSPNVTLHEVLAGATNTPHDTVVGLTVYDADAGAYFAAVVTNGGAALSSGAKTAFNTFIIGLKADGIWAQLDRFAWLGNENSIAARTDIRNPAKLWTASGSPPFTALTGYTGDGLGAYLSAVNNLSSETKYTQNSASQFVYQNAVTGTARRYNFGQTTTLNSSIGDGSNANDRRCQVNATSAAFVPTPVAPTKGLLAACRNSSTTELLYLNGTQVATGTATSTTVTAAPATGLRGNTTYSSDTIACIGYGADTSTLQSALYSRITTLAAALGTPL